MKITVYFSSIKTTIQKIQNWNNKVVNIKTCWKWSCNRLLLLLPYPLRTLAIIKANPIDGIPKQINRWWRKPQTKGVHRWISSSSWSPLIIYLGCTISCSNRYLSCLRMWPRYSNFHFFTERLLLPLSLIFIYDFHFP